MSDAPRDDRQDIHVHVDNGGSRRGDPEYEDRRAAEEDAAAASAMSAQLIWIILVVVLVVAIVLLFTTGVIELPGNDAIVDEVIPTPTN
jgi:hypothetical protein